jgi:hypothetical protein
VFGKTVVESWSGRSGSWDGCVLQLARRGTFDGVCCVVGEARLVLCGGALLSCRGELVADLPLAATVSGSVALPLVVLIAMMTMEDD